MTPRLVELSNLEAIEFPSDDPRALTVVCMHGYGADMRDLAPLAAEIPVKRSLRWIFPQAPVTLEWGGRAWFGIDIASFEEAQRTGKPRDLSRGEPVGMGLARKDLQDALKILAVPDQQLVLMGFSQGAMMAVDAAMQLESRPAGVAILSGTLVDQKTVATLAPRKKGLPFFQSHGSVDPILGFAQALALERELQAVGWLGAMHRFEGGHTIPEEILTRLGQWIDAL